MQRFLWSLLAVGLVPISLGQHYNCNGVQTVNPPANISNPYVYPSTWYYNDNPPQYAGGQNCTWNINVPKGMYAYFAVKANISNSGVLQMTDSTGYVTTITVAFLEPYYLMDPSFTVSLVTNNVGSMGMMVYWYNVKPVNTTHINLPANSSPLTLFDPNFDIGTTILADTKVSLLSIAPNMIAVNLTPLMRITQIFDGPYINSTHLGNLYQIMESGKNLVSSGKYLTLYSLYPGYNVGNTVVIQDYNDVQQFKSYRPVWCVKPDLCQVSLDATKGTAAVLRYSPSPFYVKGMSLAQTSNLSVYTDYVTDPHRLAVYTSDNSKTNIPQEFSNTFTTFVLDKGLGTIQLSSNPAESKWYIPFEGRSGFFASPNFAVNSPNQNFTNQLSGAGTFNISYTVASADLFSGARLRVIILDGHYSSTNYPQNTVYAKGDNIFVQYTPNGLRSNGALVNFHFDKYNSASSFGFLGAMIVTLWAAL